MSSGFLTYIPKISKNYSYGHISEIEDQYYCIDIKCWSNSVDHAVFLWKRWRFKSEPFFRLLSYTSILYILWQTTNECLTATPTSCKWFKTNTISMIFSMDKEVNDKINLVESELNVIGQVIGKWILQVLMLTVSAILDTWDWLGEDKQTCSAPLSCSSEPVYSLYCLI